MDYNKCPCYTCLVASICPGKEPTLEEHQKMLDEMEADEKENGCQLFLDDDDNQEHEWDNYESPPELIAQQNCPLYRKWSGLKSEEELDVEYIGIEWPKMKLLGEKEIEFHKRQNRKIC